MMLFQTTISAKNTTAKNREYCISPRFEGLRLVADSGGTNTRFNILDDESDELLFETVKLPTPKKGTEFLQQIATVIENFRTQLIERHKKSGASTPFETRDDIYTASIAVAGPVNSLTGEVIGTNTKAYTLPLQRTTGISTPFATGVQNTIGLSTNLVNDADAFVLGEVFSKKGALYGKENAIGITLGTGIGGGAVYKGNLFTINGRSVMEVGHVVIEKSGRKVKSPRTQGCWEAYASGTGLLESAKMALKKHPKAGYDPESFSNKQLFEASEQKEAWANQVLEDWHLDIAAGLANIINTLGMMDVVIGGGLCQRVDYPKLMTLVKPRLIYPESVKAQLNIVPSQLGDDAALIGAGHTEVP